MYEEAIELVQGFGIEACPHILPDRAVYRHASAAGASVIEFELEARLLPRSQRFTRGPSHM
jgi:chromosome partitioning protein